MHAKVVTPETHDTSEHRPEADGIERAAVAIIPREITLAQLTSLVVAALIPGLFATLTWFQAGALLHFSIPVVIGEIFLLACYLCDGVFLKNALHRVRPRSFIEAGVLVLTAALATTLVATRPLDASFHFGIMLVELLLGFFSWAVFSSEWRSLRRPFLIALAVGVLGQVIVAYSLAISVRGVPGINWVKFHAGTSHVRQLGIYGTALCGLAAGLLATAGSRFEKAMHYLFVLVGFAWIDLSGGRAAFCAGIGGCSLVWFLTPTHRQRSLAVELVSALLLAMPLSMIYIPDKSWGIWRIFHSFLFHDRYASGRLELWLQTLKGIGKSPWIGHGEGQFLYEVAQRQWNHPHNSILQLLYQWGIIGTGCVIAIAAPIVARIRTATLAQPDVALPAAGALSGLLLMSLVEGSLYHVYPVMVVIIALAMLAGLKGRAATQT